MNSNTFEALIQLNKDFYDKVGSDFSRTRQNPWKGWGRVVENFQRSFKGKNKVSILDLGCGNGRFFLFLRKSYSEAKLNYYGFDTNEYLLNAARKKLSFKGVYLDNADIISDISTVAIHCDAVVAFGLTHHIPSKEYRIKWFSEVAKKIDKDGLFVFTNWEYKNDDRFRSVDATVRFKNYVIQSSDLEKDDYFLTWNNDPGVYRYYHHYSKREMKDIFNVLCAGGLIHVSEFNCDGKGGKLNKYYIFRKNQMHNLK